MNYIRIEKNGIPKYKQLINGILNGINSGELKINDKLPSINVLMKKYSLSQDTILTAYNNLKSKGIISSAVGKGYYVTNDQTFNEHKVFVLFDNFTFYKEILYNSINSSFKDEGTIDIFFHHNNASQYKKLITDAVDNYTSYIIMTIEDEGLDQFVINSFPPKKVYLLDIASEKLKKKFPFVSQDFEKDVFKCLSSGIKNIKKYSKIRFLNSSKRAHILRIKKGLKKFANKQGFLFNSISEISKTKISPGDLFFVIHDRDLIKLIEKSKMEKLIPGEDFGIISYNETDLKKVIHNGISTISTNFELMGTTIAELVKLKSRRRIYNESNFIIRDST